MRQNKNSHRSVIQITILVLLITLLIGPIPSVKAGAPSEQQHVIPATEKSPYLQLVQQSTERIIIEFSPPLPTFKTTILDNQTCQEVSIAGLEQTEAAGLPALPVRGAMLGIPQNGQPSLRILEAETTSLPGKYDLCPSSQPVLEPSFNGRWELAGYTYERAPDYSENNFLPPNSVELASTGNLRNQRFAQLRFNPLQYNPVSGEIQFTQRIQVEIRFNADASATTNTNTTLDEGVFEESLSNLLLNYEQARSWRSQPDAATVFNTVAAPPSGPAYKILVDQDGIYQLTYADLVAAGVPVDTLDPLTFQLFNQSSEVAILIEGEADHSFDLGDVILFYGQKLADNKYTDTNVYWLTWGAATGLRMANLDGAPSGTASTPVEFLTTQHAEQDIRYYSNKPSGADMDHWYWELIRATSAPAFMDFTTELNNISSNAQIVAIHGALKGYSANPLHHVRLYLNNILINDHAFPAGSEYNFSINIPQSYLLDGINTLRVECPRDRGYRTRLGAGQLV